MTKKSKMLLDLQSSVDTRLTILTLHTAYATLFHRAIAGNMGMDKILTPKQQSHAQQQHRDSNN